MFTATKVAHISAGHQLNLPYDSPCRNCHGHNYRIEVTVSADQLNEHGMVCDFTLIKDIAKKLDHTMIEIVQCHTGETFADKYGNATAENIADFIGDELQEALIGDDPMGNENARIDRIVVGETGGNVVTWEPN